MANIVAIFKRQQWYFAKYDGRKKEFKGISKEDFNKAAEKHIERFWAQERQNLANKTKVEKYKQLRKYFESIPYEYQGDGLDDFEKYQRPASSGGYVAICPGERGNNVYIEPIPENAQIIKHLTRLYNEHKSK